MPLLGAISLYIVIYGVSALFTLESAGFPLDPAGGGNGGYISQILVVIAGVLL